MNMLSRLFRRRPAPDRARTLERRLSRRALLYWRSLGREGQLVRVGAFDPMALEDYSAHGFMLDLRGEGGPVACHVGPVLQEEADVDAVPIALARVPERSLLGQFARRWEEVVASGEPVQADYNFATERYHILCRGVLLPLSSDGAAIDHVYGVISWKSEKLPGTH